MAEPEGHGGATPHTVWLADNVLFQISHGTFISSELQPKQARHAYIYIV